MSDMQDLFDEIEGLKLQLAACIKFISTEMDWCHFRGEMLADNASVKNAKMLAEFLDKQEKKMTTRKGQDR